MSNVYQENLDEIISKMDSLKDNLAQLRKIDKLKDNISKEDSINNIVRYLNTLEKNVEAIKDKLTSSISITEEDIVSFYQAIHKYLDSEFYRIYLRKEIFNNCEGFYYPFYDESNESQYKNYLSLSEDQKPNFTFSVGLSNPLNRSNRFPAGCPPFPNSTKDKVLTPSLALYPHCFGNDISNEISFYSSEEKPNMLMDLEFSIELAKHYRILLEGI